MRAKAFTLILYSFAILEVFIGGARPLYSIPAAALVGLAAVAVCLPRFPVAPETNLFAALSAVLFAGYAIVRNRLSEIEHIGRQQLFIAAGALLVYLLFSLVYATPKERKRLLHFLLVLGAIQFVVGAFQFKESNQWMPLPWAQRRDEFWRASGLFISPNHFAGYMEVLTLFGASLALWGRYHLRQRIYLIYGSVFCLMGVAISGSRGGYLSTLAGLGAVAWLSLMAVKRNRPKHFKFFAWLTGIAGGVLLAGILAVMFQSDILKNRVAEINEPENMRWKLWGAAVQQFEQSPVFGTGAFSYLYFGRLFRDPSVQNDPIHVHNDYLQLLADYGMVGGGLFLLLWGVHCAAGKRAFDRLVGGAKEVGSSDRFALLVGASGALVAYTVHSVVDFNMQIPVNAYLAAFAFAILGNARAVPPGDHPRRTPVATSILKWILPAFGVAVIACGGPMVPGEFCAEVARVNLRDKKYGETLDWVRKGLRWEKRNPDLYFYGGEAAREMAVGGMGDRDIYLRDSLIAFSAGFEVFPYDSRMAVKLAQAQANLGGFLDASNTIATAEELDPNSSFVKAYRGIVELTGGYLDDAENAFQEAIELGGEGSSVARKGLDAVKETREKLEGAQPESPAVREMLEKLAATIEAESGGEESGGATPGAAEPGTTPATPDAPPPSPESPGAPSPPGATAP